MRLLLVLLCCFASLQAGPRRTDYTVAVMDELRLEVEDLKHALKTTQVELNLLDERLKKQDSGKPGKELNPGLSTQVGALEKKVAHLEKTLEKVVQDLRTLSISTSETLTQIQSLQQSLSSQEKRFEEVSKLKGTLTSISKAIGQKPAPEMATSPATRTYRVKPKDSLEKIARLHNTSVETLRKLNQLSNDKIVIDQELRLPNEPIP